MSSGGVLIRSVSPCTLTIRSWVIPVQFGKRLASIMKATDMYPSGVYMM
jgi:hypothetical protein